MLHQSKSLVGGWFFSFAVLASAIALAADWPTFRGIGRTAISPDTGLLAKWPEGGPKLLWEAAGAGRGYASLAIAGGRIYTLGDGLSTNKDEDEYLSCFSASDGAAVWQMKTGPAWNEGKSNWQSSRSTPTVDGDRVYVLTAQGELVAGSTAGNELWRKDLKAELGGKKADGWGYSESVTIDGERLVCTPGGSENTMVALNKLTGELIWSSKRADDRGAGHASIVTSEIGGERVYVQVTGSGPMGVRASDGKLLWTYDIDQTTAVIPTPIVQKDLVFFTVGYGRGGALLKQVPEGSDVKIEEVYPLKPELGNKHGGVVLVGEHVYGDSEDGGILYCADRMTGTIAWKSRSSAGSGSASVAAADGKLYVHYANGAMALVNASPDGFSELGSFSVPGSGDRPSWAHPVIVDGRLYLREGDKLLCYQLRD